MRASISFSMAPKPAAEFDELLKKKGLKRSTVLVSLIDKWVQAVKENEIETIECDKCGAVYSSLLAKCPGCSLIEETIKQAK